MGRAAGRRLGIDLSGLQGLRGVVPLRDLQALTPLREPEDLRDLQGLRGVSPLEGLRFVD